MAESQGKGLKTPVNGLFQENFEFGPLLGYDNFQNEIDTWETTGQTYLWDNPRGFPKKGSWRLALWAEVLRKERGLVWGLQVEEFPRKEAIM